MNKQSAPPPTVSKGEKTPEHRWDKAPYSWHRWGKFESLSEALLFPVLSILQLGFQLVPLSLGTISHLSSLPQHSTSHPGVRLETRPACIPSATGNGLGRQRHVPVARAAPCRRDPFNLMPREQLEPLDGNNHPCMAVTGTGVGTVAVSSPNSSF